MLIKFSNLVEQITHYPQILHKYPRKKQLIDTCLSADFITSVGNFHNFAYISAIVFHLLI